MHSIFDPEAVGDPTDNEEENGGRNTSRSRTKTRSRGPSPRSPSTRSPSPRRGASTDDDTMDSTASASSSKKRGTLRKSYSQLGPAQKIRRQDQLLEDTPEQLLYDSMIRGLKKKKQMSAAESIEAILDDPEVDKKVLDVIKRVKSLPIMKISLNKLVSTF